jgi:CubicO group peptidase (beta-lactamase class C family)
LTIEQLMRHTTGLPAYRPYYRRLRQIRFEKRPACLKKLLQAENLVYPPGQRTEYSDIGFMLLRWAIEEVSRQRLDRYVEQALYRCLEIEALFYNAIGEPRRPYAYAATENCSWREILLKGQVHDDNAFVVGGVDGHAGLFGSVEGVHRLLVCLLQTYLQPKADCFFAPQLVQRLWTPLVRGGFALGFDTPSAGVSSSGRFFSPQSVGHLGFTGTSFWVDPTREVIVVLLTNRVHPDRSDERIQEFRPRIHDHIMQSLGFAKSTALSC